MMASTIYFVEESFFFGESPVKTGCFCPSRWSGRSIFKMCTPSNGYGYKILNQTYKYWKKWKYTWLQKIIFLFKYIKNVQHPWQHKKCLDLGCACHCNSDIQHFRLIVVSRHQGQQWPQFQCHIQLDGKPEKHKLMENYCVRVPMWRYLKTSSPNVLLFSKQKSCKCVFCCAATYIWNLNLSSWGKKPHCLWNGGFFWG